MNWLCVHGQTTYLFCTSSLHVQNRNASKLSTEICMEGKKEKGEEGKRDQEERGVKDMRREGREISALLISEGSVK